MHCNAHPQCNLAAPQPAVQRAQHNHPACHRSVLPPSPLLLLLLLFGTQTGAIGELQQLEAKVLIPAYLFNKNDIRFQAKLAGVPGSAGLG